MREPIKDKGRLEHIITAIERIEEFTKDLAFEEFSVDVLRLHATYFNVQVIGEAVYKLTTDFKQKHTITEWRQIERMRHIIVHDYYQVNAAIVWNIVKEDIPTLKQQVIQYISEFPVTQ